MLKPSVLASPIGQPKHILGFKVESSFVCLLIENELKVLETNSGPSSLEWDVRPLSDGSVSTAWTVKTIDDQCLSTIIGFLLNLELQPILSSGSERNDFFDTLPGSGANEGPKTPGRVDQKSVEASERWFFTKEPANLFTSQRVDSPKELQNLQTQQPQKQESCNPIWQSQLRAGPRLPTVGTHDESDQAVTRNKLGMPVSSPILMVLRPATQLLRTLREMNELIDRNHSSKNVRLNQLANCNEHPSLNPDPKNQDKEQLKANALGAEESAQPVSSTAPSRPKNRPAAVLAEGSTHQAKIQVSTKPCSSVVYIKGIDNNKISLRQLSNLLECFGDVEIGMYHAKKEYALLKFSEQSGAKTAIKELYGKEICGKSLLLHSSELGEIVTKYFTNGKYYHVPNHELKRFQPIKKPHHICRFVNLTICFTNEFPRDIGLPDLKRLFGSALLPAKVRLCSQANEYILEFHNTKAAIEFIMNNNYSEFPEEHFFAVLTFALKTKWQ